VSWNKRNEEVARVLTWTRDEDEWALHDSSTTLQQKKKTLYLRHGRM